MEKMRSGVWLGLVLWDFMCKIFEFGKEKKIFFLNLWFLNISLSGGSLFAVFVSEIWRKQMVFLSLGLFFVAAIIVSEDFPQ